MQSPLANPAKHSSTPPPQAISLLSYGAGGRLLGALLAVATLWLSVAWALSAA